MISFLVSPQEEILSKQGKKNLTSHFLSPNTADYENLLYFCISVKQNMLLKEKIFKGKTLAILSGVGDTPAINSSIENIRNRALILGFKVYGIRQGWKGLLGEGDMVDLTNQPYNGLYGGNALFSSRTNPFSSALHPEERIPQIIACLKRYKVDVLITIGGDDTNGAARKLYEKEGIPVIGFPKTIDNDLKTNTIHHYRGKEIEAVLCPGFPTAALRISEMIRHLRSTN